MKFSPLNKKKISQKIKYSGDNILFSKIFISNFNEIFPNTGFLLKRQFIYSPVFPFFFISNNFFTKPNFKIYLSRFKIREINFYQKKVSKNMKIKVKNTKEFLFNNKVKIKKKIFYKLRIFSYFFQKNIRSICELKKSHVCLKISHKIKKF
jgi:hypothetical protein